MRHGTQTGHLGIYRNPQLKRNKSFGQNKSQQLKPQILGCKVSFRCDKSVPYHMKTHEKLRTEET